MPLVASHDRCEEIRWSSERSIRIQTARGGPSGPRLVQRSAGPPGRATTSACSSRELGCLRWVWSWWAGSVLGAFALIVYERAHALGGTDVAALVHHGDQVGPVEAQLDRFISGLIAEAGRVGALRTDVAASELANYCLHALGAAASAPSKAAVRRLVELTLAGLDADAVARA